MVCQICRFGGTGKRLGATSPASGLGERSLMFMVRRCSILLRIAVLKALQARILLANSVGATLPITSNPERTMYRVGYCDHMLSECQSSGPSALAPLSARRLEIYPQR